jgi:hypothetical protein
MTIQLDQYSNHTMGDALTEYVTIKFSKDFLYHLKNTSRVNLIPRIDLGYPSIAHIKKEKIFNFIRPTFLLREEGIDVFCAPGKDYLFHYRELIQSYASILGIDIGVNIYIPEEQDMLDILLETGIMDIPEHDIVII